MELPQEIFEELTTGAQLAPTATGAGNRVVPRIATQLSASIVRLTGNKGAKPMPALIRDLSTRGIGVEFSEPIHANDLFAVRLQRRDGSPLWIHCQSVRWSPIDGKQCVIGAKFTGVFSPPHS